MRIAAALPLLLISGTPVLALPPSPTPQVELFLSGATAQDEALENLMRLKPGIEGARNVCEAGTLDIYRAKIEGVAKRVFYCRASANVAGLAAGTRIAIHKSSGGSGEGVTPVSAGSTVAYLDLARLPEVASCRTGVEERGTEDFIAYRNHTGCDGAGKRAVPRAGISDVEPALVGGITQPLTVKPQNQLVWGLPVTKNLRNALQAAQGLVRSSVPHDDPGRDTAASMPSLSRAQVAGLFSGTLNNWEQLYDSEGTPFTRSRFLAPAPPANPDASGASPGAYRPERRAGSSVYICRRIESSGTQASYEAHYLRNRCVKDTPPFVRPNDGSDVRKGGDVSKLVRIAAPAGSVYAGTGTGDVRDCLDAHEQFNRWAVGILSTENPGNNGNREFRYLKVDGAAPTLLNAYGGRWAHVSEQSMQWRRSFTASLGASDEGRLLSFVASNMGLPRVIRALNSGFVHPWGQGGYLAPATVGFKPPKPPVTDAALRENPVAGITRSLNGLSNCAEPVVVQQTPVL